MANLTRGRRGQGVSSSLDPIDLVRNLMGWDPFREMAPIAFEGQTFSPQFDVKETTDAYVLRADLPGIDEKDLDITVTGNRLTINGKREAEERQEGENYYAFERSFGSFSRSFVLPDAADLEHVDAELKHGVLTLSVGKKAALQPKKVSVKGAIGEVVDKVKGVFTKEENKEETKTEKAA